MKFNKIKYEDIRKYKSALLVIILCAIAATIILLPQYIRNKTNQGIYAGEEHYADLRIISQIQKEGIKTKYLDMLSTEKKYQIVTPYHFTIAFASNFGLHPEKLAAILFPLLGIISATLFFYLLKKLGCTETEATIASLFFIISPIFMHTFTHSGSNALALSLVLITAFMLLNQNKILQGASIAALLIIPFFNMLYGLIILIVLLAYAKTTKTILKEQEQKERMILIIAIAAVAITTFVAAFSMQQQSYSMLAEKNAVQEIISEVGGKLGFSIFAIILAITGAAALWRKRNAIPYFLILIGLLIYTAFANTQINIFTNIGIAYLAAMGIMYMNSMEWKVDVIKSLTITLTICGILFTIIVQANIFMTEKPNNEIRAAAIFLSTDKDENSVLTHHSNSEWIKMAGKKPLLDSNSNNRKIYEDTNTLLYTRSLEGMQSLMKKYNIKYVWVDKEMISGKVWNKEDEGMLLLIQKSRLFEKAYENKEITIWKYNS